MKSLICFSLLTLSVAYSNADTTCATPLANMTKDWRDMTGGCVDLVRRQIKKEIEASMTYLSMGAHFSKDTINRPGFAGFFFNAAGEEREHAIKLIEYLLMRGSLDLTENFNSLFDVQTPDQKDWTGVDALRDALQTEADVTKSIKSVIVKCENDDRKNDYHFVDYLTGEFLEEQYKGQRELAGKISTLDKLMRKHGVLGEFLFDKKNF